MRLVALKKFVCKTLTHRAPRYINNATSHPLISAIFPFHIFTTIKFSSHFWLDLIVEFRHKCEQDVDCDGELICSLISNATKTTGFNRAPVSVLKLCQCPDRTDEYDDSCNGNFSFLWVKNSIFVYLTSFFFNSCPAYGPRHHVPATFGPSGNHDVEEIVIHWAWHIINYKYTIVVVFVLTFLCFNCWW